MTETARLDNKCWLCGIQQRPCCILLHLPSNSVGIPQGLCGIKRKGREGFPSLVPPTPLLIPSLPKRDQEEKRSREGVLRRLPVRVGPVWTIPEQPPCSSWYHRLMDPVNTEGRALTVAAPSMPPASEPPPNPLLQTFRGHRTRTWGEVEARKCLQYLSYGMSQEAACIKSGIPVDAMYTDAPNARLLREAITEVYAHEGAAVWEDELYRIGLGDGEYQRTSAIVAGLKLHGRLRDKEAAGSVTINADQIVLQYQALSPEDREALRELARQRLKPTVIDAAAVPLASPPS